MNHDQNKYNRAQRSSEYAQKLRDRRWQRKRLEAMEAARWLCQRKGCSDYTSELHVHHPKYHPDRDPWEYPISELEVLCDTHHALAHGLVEVHGGKYYPKDRTPTVAEAEASMLKALERQEAMRKKGRAF